MLTSFFQSQLDSWPLASDNFKALDKVETRHVNIGGFYVTLQHNPARIVSTAARVDAKQIAARKCFLCKTNRPDEQLSLKFEASTDFEILVNPYPIAPEHYTIAATAHCHQDTFNPEDMARFVRAFPCYAAFFNGSTAGASAPDHLHFQACRKEFLDNLIGTLTEAPGSIVKMTPEMTVYAPADLPMHLLHFVSQSVSKEMTQWLDNLVPGAPLSSEQGMRNILMWTDADARLHTLLFPRRAHRPACYYAEGEEQLLVSPGTIDMGGTLILPRKTDFEQITASDIRRIYDEVSLDYRSLPTFQSLLLL